MKMLRWAAIVLLVIVQTVVAVEFDIHADEPTDRAETPVRWPISVGVPFAEGVMDDDTPISLGDTPVQTQTIGRWRLGSHSPQWVLLDYQSDIAAAGVPTQHVTTGITPATPKHTVTATREGDDIVINTGVSRFVVNSQSFDPFSQYTVGKHRPLVESTEVYWIDREANRYTARAFGENKVEVELAGPLRAVVRCEGWYAPVAGGEAVMRYQMRIAAFAGLPYVRIYHTLIWTGDDSIEMREFGLSFKLSHRPGTAMAGIGSNETVTGTGQVVEFVQEKYEYGELIEDGQHQPIDRLSGYVTAGGVAIALRDMAMQLPKAFTVDRDRIDVQLWAPQAGFMGMRASDRMQSPSIPDNQQEWKRFNTYSPQGAAKTHEMWVWPAELPQHPAAINDLVQRPVFAMADPAYQCATDAIAYLRPASATPESHQYLERGLDLMFRTIAKPLNKLKDFDLWNFGDVHLFAPAGWRTWDGNGYNWSQVPWHLFYRSGKRHYRLHGERNARHVMDVDICHHGPLKADAHHKALGFKHMYSPLHWAWGPVWDNFHTHPQYLLHYYHLTGYERAADVLHLMAKSSRANLGIPEPERDSLVSRTQYGQINPKVVFYEFTGDPYFLDAAKAWAAVALNNRDEHGDFKNNNFWHFFHRGLMNVHRYTADHAVRDALLKHVERFSAAPTSGFEAAHYTREAMTSFAFAAQVTGDAQYLQYPLWRIMQQAKMVQTDGEVMPWEGGAGYSAMARTTTSPFFDGGLPVLGAWHDAGFPAIEPWPGNVPHFGSRTIEQEGYASGMTLYAKKDAGVGGQIQLRFKSSNLGNIEALGDTPMQVRITDPNGATREVLLATLTPDPLRFETDAPAGQYRIDIRGPQPVFWLTPTSDLPGLVIEYADGRVPFAFRYEPGRIYFHMHDDAAELKLTRVGMLRKVILPVRIVGNDDAELGRMDQPADGPRVIDVPKAYRGQVLSLAKGYMAYVPWDANLPALQFEGVKPWFAMQAAQWFEPAP